MNKKHKLFFTSQLMIKCIVSAPCLDTLCQLTLRLQWSNIKEKRNFTQLIIIPVLSLETLHSHLCYHALLLSKSVSWLAYILFYKLGEQFYVLPSLAAYRCSFPPLSIDLLNNDACIFLCFRYFYRRKMH